jgi:uncharacterized protein YqeY
MSLTEQIDKDIKAAMLAKESKKLEALRAVKAAILLEKTKGSAISDLSEADEMKLLQKLVKQRKESGAIYKSENRNDLADDEFYQASVIEEYLPEQLSEDEVSKVISKIIESVGASSIKDMGKVMGMATKELSGKADNKMIANIVKKQLHE